MTITAQQVVELYNERTRNAGPMQQALREVTALYQGDIAVPLPELGANEKPAIANIARQGIDQIGQRIASVFPEIQVNPSSASKSSVKRAQMRRRALYGFHEQNRTQRQLRRRARFLVGYASAPVVLRPDFKRSMPQWQTRSPVGMYLPPSGDPDNMRPTDAIFATRQTLGWLKRKGYDAQYARLKGRDDTSNTEIDVIEFHDAECSWLVAAKRGTASGNPWDIFEGVPTETHMGVDFAALAFTPNRAGVTPVVVPGAITLGPQKSPYNQIVGMYQASAQIEAMARHATAKGIFPETWLVPYQTGDEPELVQAPDPFDGVPGISRSGKVEQFPVQPQFAARGQVNELERSMRLTAGLSPELGGEAATNVRTGRRGEQLLGAVLDFPVQEGHELFEESIEHENAIAVAFDVGYFRDIPKVWAVNFGGERGDLAYTPGDLWRRRDKKRTLADSSRVSYFMAGLDASDRIIALGQRKGMETISDETLMRHDPVIDDVEAEIARIRSDKVDRAVYASIEQQVLSPESQFSTRDLIEFQRLVAAGKTVAESWAKVEEMVAERAAEQAAAAPTPLDQQNVESVEAPPSIGAPPESVGNLSSLLTGLRSPAVFATPQG